MDTLNIQKWKRFGIYFKKKQYILNHKYSKNEHLSNCCARGQRDTAMIRELYDIRVSSLKLTYISVRIALILCKLQSQLFTRHKVFSVNIHISKLVETPKQQCMSPGTSKLHLTACSITQALHLIKITSNNEQHCHKQRTNMQRTHNKNVQNKK